MAAVHTVRHQVIGVPLRGYRQTRIVADHPACRAKLVDAVVDRSSQIVCGRCNTSKGAKSRCENSADRYDGSDLDIYRHGAPVPPRALLTQQTNAIHFRPRKVENRQSGATRLRRPAGDAVANRQGHDLAGKAVAPIRGPSTSREIGAHWKGVDVSTAVSRPQSPKVPAPLAEAEVEDIMIILYALAAAFGLGVLWLGTCVRVVKQFERGVVFRFGRVQTSVRGPGLTLLIPIADRLQKVNMQIVTMPVPAQDGITRDNVTVRVDAVIYFTVADPVRVVVGVQDYVSAIGQVAQTSLRSIIGKSDLDDLLSNREGLNRGLELMIDSPAVGWGVHIDRVEIKDVVLPDSMKRSIARQAEAERERRARVIPADGELQASEKLAQAAEAMTVHPAALQLRLLETVVEVAAEKNSTLVLPFPVELLRFLERATPHGSRSRDDEAAMPSTAAAASKSEMSKLDPPQIPDDASGLEVDTRIAGR